MNLECLANALAGNGFNTAACVIMIRSGLSRLDYMARLHGKPRASSGTGSNTSSEVIICNFDGIGCINQ